MVGGKHFHGSGSQWPGELAATMYRVLMTLKLWRLNARTWLGAYLQACADNGNQAPDDLGAFLPWAMDAKRLAHLRACPLGAPPIPRRHRQLMSIYCGREFSPDDIQTIRRLMEQPVAPTFAPAAQVV